MWQGLKSCNGRPERPLHETVKVKLVDVTVETLGYWKCQDQGASIK